ncbi:MAG: alpha-L-fucosidase [Clostridia bacterium]|nr:alpha-L-fucosidase [Clostridia bacterium]
MIPKALTYIANFEKLGFGMFVHWGLYSQMGKGEWAMRLHKIPKEEYMKLFDTFTAEDFNAEELVLTAKNAGMKYITLTTRHHEGFSLYDTCGLNEYDAPHSPAKRDLVREFVDACNKYDIIPFFYHTTLDWWKDEFETDFDAYLEYLRKSVEILCKNYGKIGGLWFDGNWSKKGADWKEDELYATIRKYQPEAMIINNTGIHDRGALGNIEIDSVTFEQGRPEPMNREGAPKYLAAEMCETINDHWGVGACDFNNKSTAQLIETLCACRKVGANYLLNIGPTAQGGILPIQKCTLECVGEWVKIYEDAIRGAKPCGVVGKNKDFALRDGNKMYFFVHNLAINGDADVTVSTLSDAARTFSGIEGTIKNLRWMDNDRPLEHTQMSGTMMMHASGYPYGTNMVVRVAVADIED